MLGTGLLRATLLGHILVGAGEPAEVVEHRHLAAAAAALLSTLGEEYSERHVTAQRAAGVLEPAGHNMGVCMCVHYSQMFCHTDAAADAAHTDFIEKPLSDAPSAAQLLTPHLLL